MFGVDERRIASGLNHYLEEPDYAAISASSADPVYKRSMEIRKAAMKAVVELYHSEKWTAALKHPSRPELHNLSGQELKSFFTQQESNRTRKEELRDLLSEIRMDRQS